jgi:RHS repeat-associated protein
MKLDYETANFFDGNIGKQEWKSNIDNVKRSFTYTYDGASRIKTGIYASDKLGENYSLNNVTYDFNGNITNLSRNGYKSNNSFGLVDNLNYTYQANSNKIQAVTDASNETASFTDATGTTDYTYSLDGSLTSDANKGISLIEYNYLKLPKKITFINGQNIEYEYDATGKKLREKAKDGTWTDYLGNLIYKANNLFQIGFDEGRINAQNEYEYVIQDHLGNVRVMFRDSSGVAKITQTENFGVWGESLKKLNYYRSSTDKNQFVYTGHERNEELEIYDAKARIFDPIVPRFWQIDPLTEISKRWSPYSYTYDNPIRFIDPDGMSVTESDYSTHYEGTDAQNRFAEEKDKDSQRNNDDNDKGKKDKNGNTNFNGGYRDKNGNSHFYPSMDVTMTMSDEGRDAYSKAALKETAFAIIPWGRILRLFGLNRVSSFLFGRFFGGAITNKAVIEVTEASIEKALEGSTMQTLQGKVSLPMIQRYVKMLENGLVAPPIKVADGIIVEGNHRYIAGRLFGVEPAQVPYLVSPSQMNRAVPIQKTIVDLLDWGGH